MILPVYAVTHSRQNFRSGTNKIFRIENISEEIRLLRENKLYVKDFNYNYNVY